MEKRIVFIDMDGVLVDFGGAIKNWFENNPDLIEMYKHVPDTIPGIFRDPLPIFGAKESVYKLAASNKYDLFIATTSPWGNPEAATDKRNWIVKHFGDLFKKKMFITHRKDLLKGHYLIDDRVKNGAADFGGELLSFGWSYEKKRWNEYPTWDDVLKRLLNE